MPARFEHLLVDGEWMALHHGRYNDLQVSQTRRLRDLALTPPTTVSTFIAKPRPSSRAWPHTPANIERSGRDAHQFPEHEADDDDGRRA